MDLISIIIVLLLVAFVVAFIAKFWWLILIVVAVWYFWKKHKANHAASNKKVISQPEHKTVDPVTRPNKKNVYLPKPVKAQDVLDYLKVLPSPIILEGGKSINTRTGNPMVSKKAIDLSIQRVKGLGSHQQLTFRHLVEMTNYDRIGATREYLGVISARYYDGAMLAYQCGDWALAEKWWLSIIDLLPYECSKRLAILYRKQHRYKDVSDMYAVAINDSEKPYVHLRPGQDQKMVSSFMKSSEKYLAMKDKDKSKGVKTYPSLVDLRFVDVLNGNETSLKLKKQEELIEGAK